MQINRRTFVGTLSAGAAATALGSSVALEGCSAISELETWVPIGLAAFDGVITILNPVAGSALGIAVNVLNSLWNVVATAVANYQHDTTDPKNTLLQKVVAALNALSSGLDSFLANPPVGISPTIVHTIEAAFKLLVATLTSIANNIVAQNPSVGVKSARATVGAAVSKSDFVKQYNALGIRQIK